MAKEASQAGFKVVVINFRGAAGVPLTNGVIQWLGSWTDVKEPIDYIHRTYCLTQGGGEIRNLHAYGVSVGASLLALYLENEGDRSPLKGACAFAPFYCQEENIPFFKSSAMRFYDFSIGFNFY